MIKLLKFELRKLYQQKSLYIIFGIGLLSTILFMILGKVLYHAFDVSSGGGNATTSMLVVVPSSGFASLLGVYLVLFACTDYSQHTIKNIYARGYSRTAVFFSKYLISLAVTLVMALFYMVFSFVFALILGGHVKSMAGWMWGSLALQFWVLVGLHGLYFGISTMFGKTGVGIAVNVVGISLFFSLVGLILQIAEINFDLNAYNLENILQNLMGEEKLTTANLVRAIVMPLCYAVVFVGGGWLVNRRREV